MKIIGREEALQFEVFYVAAEPVFSNESLARPIWLSASVQTITFTRQNGE